MIRESTRHQEEMTPIIQLEHLDSLCLSPYESKQFEQQVKAIQDKEEFFFYEEKASLME